MHGVSGGLTNVIDGDDFFTGFISGTISSLISSRIEKLGPEGLGYLDSDTTKALLIAGGGVSGGISSSIAGGNFWKGMQQGLITAGLNHATNHVVRDGVENGYDKKGNRINDEGGDVTDYLYNDDGTIISSIDVDRRYYEKVLSTSLVPVDEYGIRRSRIATGAITPIGGAFDIFGFKEAFWTFFTSNNDSSNDYWKLSPAAFKGGGKGKSHGKGEKGMAAKASGTNNPFKKLKPDPKKPGNVLEKKDKNSIPVSKKAPPGFWDWWNKKRGK